MDSLDKHVEHISFRHCDIFAKMGSRKAGGNTSNPLLLRTWPRHWFIGLQQSHVTTESAISCNLNLGYHNSIYLLHSFACMMQAYYRAGGACCRSQGPQACGRESRQFFITSWLLLHGNMGPTFARCRNIAATSELETTNQKVYWKLHCDRHEYELLGSSEDSKFGYRKSTTKNHSNLSLIHKSNIDPGDVRAGLWLPTQ